MAFATEITIATGSKISVNYQSQEVQVGVTYQLEREDGDLMQLVEAKAAEVEKAHRRLWKQIKAERERETAQDGRKSAYTNGANGHNGNGANGSNNGHSHPNGNGVYPQNGSSNANGYYGEPPNGLPANDHGTAASGQPAYLTDAQERAIGSLVANLGMGADELQRLMQVRCGKSRVPDLSKREASQIIDELQRKQRQAQRQTA